MPRSEGLLTVSVYDLCLDSTDPAIAHIQISDVYGVDVAIVNKVHSDIIAKADLIFLLSYLVYLRRY